jgi:hypothetical protein
MTPAFASDPAVPEQLARLLISYDEALAAGRVPRANLGQANSLAALRTGQVVVALVGSPSGIGKTNCRPLYDRPSYPLL